MQIFLAPVHNMNCLKICLSSRYAHTPYITNIIYEAKCLLNWNMTFCANAKLQEKISPTVQPVRYKYYYRMAGNFGGEFILANRRF